MVKKLQKTDILFASTLLLGLFLHIFFIFSVPFSDDESFYSLVPFRILNGDSLVRYEWHLTQFSALFAYLPVYIWNAIKDSTEGIVLFMRCVYLLIHTAAAVVVYRYFRKYGVWAVMASMMFYVQVAYNIQAISYQSILALSLLFLALCLLSIYEKGSVKAYALAGVCFGCCCVCNPFLCVAFALYLVGCVVWSQREKLVTMVLDKKTRGKKDKKVTKKQKREQSQQANEIYAVLEKYNCFFNAKAILWIICGILIVAVIAAGFYFSTGGTIRAIFNNIENLLSSTEYDVASKSIFEKLGTTFHFFNVANSGMFWIIPALFLALIFDKNRKENTHRFAYLFVALIWTVLFTASVIINMEIYVCGFALPFFVVSILCYILTENKNKALFRCVYVPVLIVSVFHYIAADTHWAAIGVVLAIANVVGVFFAMDLFKEMGASKEDEEETTEKAKPGALNKIIIVCFCAQILAYALFNGVFCQEGNMLRSDVSSVSAGPYAGLYMLDSQCDRYNDLLKDMDYIKSITNEDDTVLLATYQNWLYMYLERPVATYTAWYRGTLNQDLLTRYYRQNPHKVPKYIYITSPNFMVIDEMFEYTQEELSAGILLTVENEKF